MQKSFEDAAYVALLVTNPFCTSFKLNVGQISDLVSSDSGIHIIYRKK